MIPNVSISISWGHGFVFVFIFISLMKWTMDDVCIRLRVYRTSHIYIYHFCLWIGYLSNKSPLLSTLIALILVCSFSPPSIHPSTHSLTHHPHTQINCTFLHALCLHLLHHPSPNLSSSPLWYMHISETELRRPYQIIHSKMSEIS